MPAAQSAASRTLHGQQQLASGIVAAVLEEEPKIRL